MFYSRAVFIHEGDSMFSVVEETFIDNFEAIDGLSIDQIINKFSNYFIGIEVEVRELLGRMHIGQYIMIADSTIIKSGEFIDIWKEVP